MTDNLDRHGRPLGGDRERDGRLLAAAQGIDLTAGVVDNATRAHWYERADVARAKLVDWAEHPSDCLCRHGYDCPTRATAQQREERAVAEARPHDDEPQPGDLVRVYGASGEPGVLSWVDMFGGYNGKAEVSTSDAQVVVVERAADEHADDCRGCDGPGIVPCAADRVEGDFAMRGAVAIKDLRAADRG